MNYRGHTVHYWPEDKHNTDVDEVPCGWVSTGSTIIAAENHQQVSHCVHETIYLLR